MKTKTKTVEAAFGLRLPEELAKSLDNLLKTLPKECQTLKRKASAGNTMEFVPGERADISVVSTETVDREGEVIIAKGIDSSFYQKNPVVLFGHKYDELPVGRCPWLKSVPGGLKAKTIYSSRPDNWDGPWLPDAVYSMTKEGILKGKSIGYIPLKLRAPTKEEVQWKAANVVCESAQLLEFSVAVIPMNPTCLVEAVAKGIVDELTLNRLGMKAVRPRIKNSDIDTLIRSLDSLSVDPHKIANEVEKRLRLRGAI